MAEVFLSYASPDREHAQEIFRLLNAHVPTFMDVNMEAGVRFAHEIDAQITGCSVFVLLSSEHTSQPGRWVAAELQRAMTENKPIVPVLLNGRLPLPLADRQFVSVHDREALLKVVLGHVGRPVPPLRSLPADVRLWLDDGEAASETHHEQPSTFLHFNAKLIPFIDRRAPLAALESWCDDTRLGAVRLFYGRAGAGKSRFALEAMRRQQARGWHVGFVKRTLDRDPGRLARLFTFSDRLLIAIDYAESREALLDEITSRLAALEPGHKVRVLLLTREIGVWWGRLAHRAFRAGLLDEGATTNLEQQRFDAGERAELSRSARAAFGARLRAGAAEHGAAAHGAARAVEFGAQPLSIAIDALSDAMAVAVPATTSATSALLAHEAQYWTEVASARGLRGSAVRLMARTVALTTLLGGFRTAESARATLQCAPFLAGLPATDVEGIVDGLRALYPGTPEETWIRPLEPDLLGEDAVCQVLGDPCDGRARLDLFASAIAASDAQLHHALTTLTRAARRSPPAPKLEGHLDELLRTDLARTAPLAVRVARETGDPIGLCLARVMKRQPDVAIARTVLDHLPTDTVALREAAEVACEIICVHADRAGVPQEELARCWSRRSKWLRMLARYEEALAASMEAVARFQALVDARPTARLRRGLAAAMNNHAAHLRDVGRKRAACEVAQEVVALRTSLARTHESPDAQFDLAVALNNLSKCQRVADDIESALDVACQDLRIRRALATRTDPRFMPGLAVGLNNLAACLRHVGRNEEALAAIDEAISIRRPLAAQMFDAYDTDLARAWLERSRCLLALGRNEDALVDAEAAAAIRHRLHQQRPKVFQKELDEADTQRAACRATLDVR